MIRVKVLVLIIYINYFTANANLNKNNTELVLAEILFRHGARTTYKFYPTDPHINNTFYPYGLGGLTKEGKLGEYNLGKYLKKYYKHFLGDDYFDDLIEMRSTSYNRAKISALLVLAGMFPPKEEEKFDSNINWQPIPILSKFRNEEDLLSATNCPYKRTTWNGLPNIPEVRKRYIEPYLETFKYIKNHSGFQINNPHDALEMYFILSTEEEQNLTLPDWTRKIFPEPLTSIAAQVYGYWNYEEKVRQINAGFFLKKVITEFERKMNGSLTPKKRKMFLYSGHESTLGYICNALDLSNCNDHIPPYGSAVIFELIKENNLINKYYVQLKYLKKLDTEPELIDIANCGQMCPIEKFKELYRELIPEASFGTMCQLSVCS